MPWRHWLLIMVCPWWRPTTCITQLQTNTDLPPPWPQCEAAEAWRRWTAGCRCLGHTCARGTRWLRVSPDIPELSRNPYGSRGSARFRSGWPNLRQFLIDNGKMLLEEYH